MFWVIRKASEQVWLKILIWKNWEYWEKNENITDFKSQEESGKIIFPKFCRLQTHNNELYLRIIFYFLIIFYKKIWGHGKNCNRFLCLCLTETLEGPAVCRCKSWRKESLLLHTLLLLLFPHSYKVIPLEPSAWT